MLERQISLLGKIFRQVLRVVFASGLLFCLFLPPQGFLAHAAEDEGWLEHLGSGMSERVESLPFEISGRYQVDYLGRWNGSDDDHQLFQYLRLKVTDIAGEKVSLHFSGRLSAELDGNDDDDDFFADIYDSFDHSANGRIFYLYLDIEDPVFDHSSLRLGRQYSYEPQSVFFNGAKYEQTIDRLRFYLQGGVRGSNYSSPDEDDTIGGTGVDYRLFPRTQVGYDYLRAVDDFLDDDYHSFDVLQTFGSLKAYGRFSVLNGDPDDLNLYASYYHTPLDLSLTARYYTLFTKRDRLTNEFSALVDVELFDVDDPSTIGVYFPFHLVNLTAYKSHGDRFGASVGFETRWMDENDERNDLNREYDRYFLSVEAWNFIVEGLTASVTAEVWDADASENSFAVGIDAEKQLSERLHAGAGFYFSQYRIRTTFAGTSVSDDVETPMWYCNLRYKCKENVELRVRYQVEDESDLGTAHELRLSCLIDF